MKHQTTKSTFSHRHQQTGSTLIEVLVSMLILALGIMALMAMQVRTAASIKEAENMTIVSQATQNLVEGISTNPILSLNNNNDTVASYDDYKIDNCDKYKTLIDFPADSRKSKTETAKVHLSHFCSTVSSLQGVEATNIAMKVCQNDTLGQGTFANLCTSGGTDTVVKVAWKMETSDDEDADLDIDADGNITYFYQLPLIR